MGVLVPLYRFYPSIESFLDTSVKRTIEQAKDNASLKPFDISILQVLFLIRYVEEIKGNVDNLVTLCLDEIDTDKLALRRGIEESLQRLESQTLVSRSGGNYTFLTNEERDINREVKQVEIGSAEEAQLLGELVYDDVLKGQRKHRYSKNGMDFAFMRLCDQHPFGNRVDGALQVSVVTPLNDDYGLFDHAKCLLTSTQQDGHVLVKLGDDEALAREIRQYLRTEKYIRTKSDGTAGSSTARILHDMANDNRQRRERLMATVGRLLTESKFYVAGNELENKAQGPETALEQALDYLIDNTFNRMGLLKHPRADDAQRKAEIQAVLRANDVGQLMLDLKLEQSNPQALAAVRDHIALATSANRSQTVYDLVENKFALRPFGWPQYETNLILARLLVLGEIKLASGTAAVPLEKVYDEITTPAKWRKLNIIQRKTVNPAALQAARNLGKEVFKEMGPDGEDALVEFLKGKLRGWQSSLSNYRALAETGQYPGKDEVLEGVRIVSVLMTAENSAFVEKFNEMRVDLLDFSDDFHDLDNFYGSQRPTWEKLRKAVDRFKLNRLALERDTQAAAALKRMGEILAVPAPYGLIKDADELIRKVEAVNAKLVQEQREAALVEVDKQTAEVAREAAAVYANDAAKASECLKPLQRLRSELEREESLAHVAQAKTEAERVVESILVDLERQSKTPPPKGNKGTPQQPAPAIKPRRQIVVSELLPPGKLYLETREEVDAFVQKLQQKLRKAIDDGERIHLK